MVHERLSQREVPKLSYICPHRIQGLIAADKKQGIGYAQADDEYKTWKRNHRKEEVAILKNQVHADPAPALAGLRNLRRLNIFTKINHFVLSESNDVICAKTRAAEENWVNTLLVTKEDADFEKVVVHVRSEVVNVELHVKLEQLESTYTHADRRNVDGDAEIRKDIGLF